MDWREVHTFAFVDAGVADVFLLADGKAGAKKGERGGKDGKLSRAELTESFALFGTVGGGRRRDEL